MKTLMETAKAARAAAAEVAQLSTEEKNAALLAMADALEANMGSILAANAADMERERANGMSSDLLDRLALNEGRVRDMALGLRQVAELPDPVGEVVHTTVRPNGLRIGKRRVPLGVIGIIYESRPNVTVDAAVLCLKSGNAVILRGGKEAFASNRVLVELMQSALASVELPADAVSLVMDTTRESAR